MFLLVLEQPVVTGAGKLYLCATLNSDILAAFSKQAFREPDTSWCLLFQSVKSKGRKEGSSDTGLVLILLLKLVFLG